MPTVCELKIEAKKKGLKGYSNMNKAQLQALVSQPPPQRRAAPKKKTKSRGRVMAPYQNPYD